MKKLSKFLIFLLCGVMLLSAAACGGDDDKDTAKTINILTTGWVAKPTDADDPYKKWLKTEYGVNVNLNATMDFDNTVNISLGDKTGGKPDIISFPEVQAFRDVQKESEDASRRPLLLDWKPYLDKMPNVKKVIESSRKGQAQSIAEKMFTDSEGRLTAIWTMPSTPTWAMKIREDWANKYRATAEGAGWNPDTPQDLLDFCNYIKNTDMDGNGLKDEYGFTADGSNKNFGVTGTWIPLMFGRASTAPWSMYIDGSGTTTCAELDGSHKAMLDFFQKVVTGGLIDPSWQSQTWQTKTLTHQGKIGIEWYPANIVTEAQSKAPAGEDRSNWWKTYPVPCEPGMDGGKMPLEGYVGNIISVTKTAALDTEKMDIICKLINDVTFYIDNNLTGTARYVRSKTYDALRWGIGIETGLAFQPITGSTYTYINGSAESYRQTAKGAGAWDWGAWFSSGSNGLDGIVQGNSATPDALTQKVIEQIEITNGLDTFDQIGAALNLSPAKVNAMETYKQTFEHKYVKAAAAELAGMYADFMTKWNSTYDGPGLVAQADAQFIALGMK